MQSDSDLSAMCAPLLDVTLVCGAVPPALRVSVCRAEGDTCAWFLDCVIVWILRRHPT